MDFYLEVLAMVGLFIVPVIVFIVPASLFTKYTKFGGWGILLSIAASLISCVYVLFIFLGWGRK
jgi:amino acid permease